VYAVFTLDIDSGRLLDPSMNSGQAFVSRPLDELGAGKFLETALEE
jgi:hypothetical protein